MIRTILTDIEGTTSSLSFVKEVLFPYAAQHLHQYIHKHIDDPSVQEQLTATADIAGLPVSDTAGLVQQLTEWIANDKKITPLKALQGMIWESGYTEGAYQAHLYADAEHALRGWRQQGIDLYVYSSGSIHAQKLFFKFSQYGDLGSLFSNYFDTTSGAKSEPDSYVTIAAAIGRPAENILFLSDVEAELDAAKMAGFATVRVVRHEDYGIEPASAQSDHACVADFHDISKLLK